MGAQDAQMEEINYNNKNILLSTVYVCIYVHVYIHIYVF